MCKTSGQEVPGAYNQFTNPTVIHQMGPVGPVQYAYPVAPNNGYVITTNPPQPVGGYVMQQAVPPQQKI